MKIKLSNKKNLKKPSWVKIKIPNDFSKIKKIKNILRKNNLHTVCEEAACPNIHECFGKGTATFMILGSICTRKCTFCNVTSGRPYPPDILEPFKLAKTISQMFLNYVVITSVDRDDLRDGGAQHFSKCIKQIRQKNPNIKIEILVPDFKKSMDVSLNILKQNPPDIFNHNMENVPRLYKKIKPGANYYHSLMLLAKFKEMHPHIPTKSGLMVGLGETDKEIIKVMQDLKKVGVSIITIGQYLSPNNKKHPVQRYLKEKEFNFLKNQAILIGFKNILCGTFVRSSYHASLQVKDIILYKK